MSAASEHYSRPAAEARTAEASSTLPSSEDRRRWVLEEIQRDAQRDVERFEGQPMTGKTVAEYMACQAAAIAAVARVVATLLPSEMPVFVIKAKDALALEAVEAYRELCTKYGLHGQASEVQLAINEIELWQQDHGDEMRLPDHKHVPAPYVNPGDDTVNGSWST